MKKHGVITRLCRVLVEATGIYAEMIAEKKAEIAEMKKKMKTA